MKRYIQLVITFTALGVGAYATWTNLWLPRWTRIRNGIDVHSSSYTSPRSVPRVHPPKSRPIEPLRTSALPSRWLGGARMDVEMERMCAATRSKLAGLERAVQARNFRDLLKEADEVLESHFEAQRRRREGIECVDPSIAAWLGMVRDAEASPELRAGALRGLQAHAPDFRTSAVVESILPLMETADDHVRGELCHGLAGMTLPIAVETLVNRLRRDTAATVRSAAASSLWRAAGEASVRAALEEASRDPDHEVREWAASSLASKQK